MPDADKKVKGQEERSVRVLLSNLCPFYQFEQAILIGQALRLFAEPVLQPSIDLIDQLFVVCMKSDLH